MQVVITCVIGMTLLIEREDEIPICMRKCGSFGNQASSLHLTTHVYFKTYSTQTVK